MMKLFTIICIISSALKANAGSAICKSINHFVEVKTQDLESTTISKINLLTAKNTDLNLADFEGFQELGKPLPNILPEASGTPNILVLQNKQTNIFFKVDLKNRKISKIPVAGAMPPAIIKDFFLFEDGAYTYKSDKYLDMLDEQSVESKYVFHDKNGHEKSCANTCIGFTAKGEVVSNTNPPKINGQAIYSTPLPVSTSTLSYNPRLKGFQIGSFRITAFFPEDPKINKPIEGIDAASIVSTEPETVIIEQEGSQSRLFKVNPLACDQNLQVESCNCNLDLPTPSTASVSKDLAYDLTNKIRCDKEFDPKDWDQDTPPVEQLPSKQISQKMAIRYLLRFSKPKGFEAQAHYSILMALLSSDLPKTHPQLLQHALSGIAASDSRVYQQVMQNYPGRFLNTTPTPTDSEACRSPTERATVREAVWQSIIPELQNISVATSRSLADWKKVTPLLPVILAMPKSQQDEVFNHMYRTLANGAVENETRGVFTSKVTLFTKNYVSGLFNRPTAEMTDVTTGSSTNSLVDDQIQILGSSPILYQGHSAAMNDYGFFNTTLPLETAKGKTTQTREVSWEHAGQKMTATLHTQVMNPGDYLPTGKSPDYGKMWADKKLTGLVVIGDNLGPAAPRIGSQYLEYYINEGFEFSAPTETENSIQFLRDHIASGETDYVMKESHSYGLNSDLITLTAKAQVMVGTKKLAGGKEEKVYILTSSTSGPSDSRWSFADMSEWMKSRSNPLIYLNSSCWSMQVAPNETASISNPLFVNIASDSKTTSFVNSPKATKYHMLEGFRDGQSYEQIRAQMKQTPRYVHGDNRFRFPDEPSYTQSFKDSNLSVDVEIKDENGLRYHLDQQVRH